MNANQEFEGTPYQWKEKTILITEDVDVNFLFLEKILSATGASIIRSLDGENAIETIKNNPAISLVLMDIYMPGIDGFEATKRIKQIRPELPVIIQTIQNLETGRELSLESGADGFVQKPLNISKLLSIIDRFISGKQR